MGVVRGERERDRQMRQGMDWTDLDICAGFEDRISADHGGCMCVVRCTSNVERRESVELRVEEKIESWSGVWLRDSAPEEEEREGWQTSLTARSS